MMQKLKNDKMNNKSSFSASSSSSSSLSSSNFSLPLQTNSSDAGNHAGLNAHSLAPTNINTTTNTSTSTNNNNATSANISSAKKTNRVKDKSAVAPHVIEHHLIEEKPTGKSFFTIYLQYAHRNFTLISPGTQTKRKL